MMSSTFILFLDPHHVIFSGTNVSVKFKSIAASIATLLISTTHPKATFVLNCNPALTDFCIYPYMTQTCAILYLSSHVLSEIYLLILALDFLKNKFVQILLGRSAAAKPIKTVMDGNNCLR